MNIGIRIPSLPKRHQHKWLGVETQLSGALRGKIIIGVLKDDKSTKPILFVRCNI